MKRINTDILKSLKPCENRYKVWLENYAEFDGSLLDFLELDKITAKDKIWVAVRVMPRDLVEVFAIDCAFSAAANPTAADFAADAASYYVDDYVDDYAYYAGYAAYYAASAAAAYYAAAAADDAASAADYATAAERENQVDALIMLIKSEGEL